MISFNICSLNVVRMNKSRVRWRKWDMHSSLVEKFHQCKRPLQEFRHTWEDNTKKYLTEIGCEVWTGLTWLRKVSNGKDYNNETSGSINARNVLTNFLFEVFDEECIS
jgi:hypothetical protein